MQTNAVRPPSLPALDGFRPAASQAPFRDLTEAELDTFRRDGVICLRQLYGSEWRYALSEALDVVGLRDSGQRTKIKSGVFEWLSNDLIRDFILFGPTAKPVAQALGARRLNSFGDQVFIKDGLLMEPTPWHHDSTFFPIDGDQVASVWTALDPVTADGSALEFVIGSHLWPNRYKAIGIGGVDHSTRELEALPDIEAHRGDYDIRSWDLEPGDALLFHGFTLHGSRGNATAQRRRAIATRWTGDDVTYTASRPSPWAHGLEEGDPLSGPIFPQVLPHLIEGEVADRLRGPLLPDPEKIKARLAQIEASATAAA